MKTRKKKPAPRRTRTNVKALRAELRRVTHLLDTVRAAENEKKNAEETARLNRDRAKPAIEALISTLNLTAQTHCDEIQKAYGVVVRVKTTVTVG